MGRASNRYLLFGSVIITLQFLTTPPSWARPVLLGVMIHKGKCPDSLSGAQLVLLPSLVPE
jgi:hypothetical protein